MLGGSITNNSSFRRRRTVERIVFSANTGTGFTIPATGVANQQVNGFVTVTTTGGTGPFSGTTGWSNTGGNSAQPVRFDIPVSSPAGSTRSLNIRFNAFTLVGSCVICGQLITPSSTQTVPNPYPTPAIGYVTGKIQAGHVYNQPSITFIFPGLISADGRISFEANNNGPYNIFVDAIYRQIETNSYLRDF